MTIVCGVLIGVLLTVVAAVFLLYRRRTRQMEHWRDRFEEIRSQIRKCDQREADREKKSWVLIQMPPPHLNEPEPFGEELDTNLTEIARRVRRLVDMAASEGGCIDQLNMVLPNWLDRGLLPALGREFWYQGLNIESALWLPGPTIIRKIRLLEPDELALVVPKSEVNPVRKADYEALERGGFVG